MTAITTTPSSSQVVKTALTIHAGDVTGESDILELNTKNGSITPVGFVIPTMANAATLTMQMSPDNGSTWLNVLLDTLGSQWNAWPSPQNAGAYQALDVVSILGATSIRFLAGVPGTPVTQATDVTIEVITRQVQ